jgi:hypothetical protein
LIQLRLRAGTYSSQIAGGSTTWLSQSKTGKLLREGMVIMRTSSRRRVTLGRSRRRRSGAYCRDASGRLSIAVRIGRGENPSHMR